MPRFGERRRKTLDAEAALKTAEAEGVQRAAELADWQARLSQNGRDAQAAFSILRGPVAIGIGVVIAGALMLDQTELLVFVAGLAAFVSGVFVLAHGLHTAGKKIQPAKPVSKVASN